MESITCAEENNEISMNEIKVESIFMKVNCVTGILKVNLFNPEVCNRAPAN
jgi:hypothetical protein